MAHSSPMAVRIMTSVKRSVSESVYFGASKQGIRTGVLLFLPEELVDLVTDLTRGDLDVVLGGAVIVHEGKEVIVGDVELLQASGSVYRATPQVYASGLSYQLVLATGDVRDVHVVGGRGQILELLASEDVDGDQVDLGVTVLAGLGGGHLDNLARAVLDDDVTVLPQSRALHGEGGGRTGVGAVEGDLMLW